MGNTEHGSLSINSENIFPIIKKWLYSDHDIFFRELISNGCDAVTKLKKLELMSEYTIPEGEELCIRVLVNPEEKTIKFIDNGIGMTADEVKEYINQIAFSGAAAFLEKYKDKTNEDQIIGHFGLGFYSSFMVAHKVTIETLSWQEGAKAVRWESEEGVDFEMGESDYAQRGTQITLYLNEDSYEFSNEYRAKEVIEKYCSFMPVPIYFRNETVEEKPEDDEEEEITEESEEKTEGEEEIIDAEVSEDGKAQEVEKEKKKKGPKPLNDTTPLWTKHPNECTEEEYKEFYRKVFHDYKEPLFWIHLNMDYPFNLKGILYFPKINTEYDSIEGTIKLYNNQVFIADNIKEVIPEFMMLLKGVIDCPDLPLNVSRSALQNDGFVKKISDYITKKIADKLSGMYKVERESYEKYWDDISPFIKFGCLKDEKFRDKMKDYIIYKNLEKKYVTLEEYLDAAKKKAQENAANADGADANAADGAGNDGAQDAQSGATEGTDGQNADADSKTAQGEAADDSAQDAGADAQDTEKDSDNADASGKEPKKDIVYYVTDEQQQSQYIRMFTEQGIDAVILTHNIDQPFISQLEQGNDKIRFQRIDADLTDTFKEEVGAEDEEELKKVTDTLTELFRKVLGKEKLTVKVEKLKDAKISSMVTLSEESRRMQDMMKMYNMYGMDPTMFANEETLVLNANNALVQYVFAHGDGEHVPMFCEQLYDLALISHKPLAPEAMSKFIARSNEIMMLLAK
ncbi:MAG: molecular chaperone HtpG [Lachnospiraceae bacterium]|nr:molecular chaperone HtpG [Lachnospiraceae bacterium]